ncbi:MAG: EAL domain-containing protein [Rhizobium sp.]|nr:EAL domain-containing protein [Rhizobium sp.]
MLDPERAWNADEGAAADAAPDVRALADFVDALPIGLGIFGADGAAICANSLHAELAARHADTGIVSRNFEFSVAGKGYVATLLFEDAEQAGREQALIRRAYFDELTGLPNRRLIEQSVKALIEAEEAPFALAFIDVDGFKHVNDFYGHSIGDGLLVQIAERVGADIRPSDMLARLSGDEFMLLISPADDEEHLQRAVDGVAERLRQPFYIEGNEIFSSGSIGVSLYPRDGSSYEALRANADRAMYRGKAIGTGSVQFFDSSIEHAAIEKSRLEQRLRLAIRDRRVSCAYQPKVDIQTGRIYGVEVLLRWMDEDGAIQPPGDFIALAIELGLMDELTYLVLEKTIRSIDRINEAFGEAASISLNVAAKQAGDIRFMKALLDRIAATGFARRFILEITEEAFVSKSTFQESVLPLIRDIGARVSIDDFGVGYSSLSALADITADEVKIDRSFITNLHQRPRSQNILKAVEALSRSLGMEVIVEGLETFEELAYLRACTSIRYAQGYYFSRPVMLEELAATPDEDSRSTPVSRAPAANRTFAGRGG